MNTLAEIALTHQIVALDAERLPGTLSEIYIERVLNNCGHYWRHVQTNSRTKIHLDKSDRKWVKGKPRKRKPRSE
jgi:hypothetical protein